MCPYFCLFLRKLVSCKLVCRMCFELTVIWFRVPFSLQQGSLQIYLKSKNGPIEVYLCPEEGLEDGSPVKSAVTPKKEFPQPLGPPTATPMAQPSYSVKEEPAESKLGLLKFHVQYSRILTLTDCSFLGVSLLASTLKNIMF